MHFNGTTKTTLPESLDLDFPNVIHLRIEDTDLHEVTKQTTSSLHNLENLYLGKNKIKTIGEKSFDNMRKLKTLYLNKNQLKNLPNEIFSMLVNLKRLWISDNQLTNLNGQLLAQNKNLELFYAKHNDLTSIDETIFDLENLEMIDLMGNVCINKSNRMTPKFKLKEHVKTSCTSKTEDIRQISILMMQIIQQLSFRNIEFHNKNTEYSIKKCDLIEKCKDSNKCKQRLSLNSRLEDCD